MVALAKAEEILAENEVTLSGVIRRLWEIQENIEKLQNLLKKEEAKKTELERQKQLCEERMARVIKLIASLSDEQKRWIIIVDNLKISLENAIGDILLSSGTYGNIEYRSIQIIQFFLCGKWENVTFLYILEDNFFVLIRYTFIFMKTFLIFMSDCNNFSNF